MLFRQTIKSTTPISDEDIKKQLKDYLIEAIKKIDNLPDTYIQVMADVETDEMSPHTNMYSYSALVAIVPESEYNEIPEEKLVGVPDDFLKSK